MTSTLHARMSLLATGALVAMTACTADEDGRRRAQRGDTLVVHSQRPTLADTLEPVETARYGRATGSEEYLFSDIYAVAVGPGGDVYVHDDGRGIRRFDADGSFASHVARAGEGPAEVAYVVGLAVSGGGRVGAYDLGNGRVTVFEPDSSVWSVRKPEGPPRYRSRTILFRDDGSLWAGVNPRHPETGAVAHPRPTFVRVLEDGSFVDTVFTPAAAAADCPALSERRYRSGFWEDAREPFVPKVKWALGPDGTFVAGCPADYGFDVRRPDGSVIRIVRDWTALTMPEEQRDFFERWAEVPRPPTERPAYVSFVLPGDGRIWVFPTQPNPEMEVPTEVTERTGLTEAWSLASTGSFDVFDETGQWLAVVRLPPEVRYSGFPTEPDIIVRGDTIWAVAQDSFDIQYVVRYEVPELRRE